MGLISYLMQAPLILLNVVSFGASIYAAINDIAGVTYVTPIILGVLLLLYGAGRYLQD